MYVCLYNFYLNKLLKLFILLKEIIMIIKTHIKLILNSKQNKTYELRKEYFKLDTLVAYSN